MSSTQATSSPLFNLSAQPKPVSRGQDGGKGFEQLLQGQVQASVRDTQPRPVKPASASERRPEAAKQLNTKDSQANPAGPPADQSEAVAQTIPQSAPTESETAVVDEEGCEQIDEQDVEPIDAGQVQASVWLMQLQQFVSAGVDAAQAQADEAGQPMLKHAGLAQVLQADDVEPPLPIADKPSLPSVQQLERQQLPESALSAEPELGQMDFSKLLNDSKQAQATPVSILSGVQVVRQEPLRASAGEGVRHAYTLHQGVGESGWGRELGSKVVMMVSMQHQEVEMHLNPPNLGPLEVKLSLNQDQASLTFVAATAPVREALQASLPKLTEMMAETGIALGQVNVESRGRQDEQSADQRERKGRSLGGGSEERVDLRSVRVIRPGLGRVNLFV